MRAILVNAAIVTETVLLIWTAYVLYRWAFASGSPDTAFSDLIPYRGAFAVVVAPWLAALAIIPACWLALRIAGRLRRP